MHRAVIRERSSGAERMHESRSLVDNSRVPQTGRHPRRTRGTAVSGRAPRPDYRIAGVNHDGRRLEKESTRANHHCDRGSPCDRGVENQERGDDRHQHRDA